MVPACSSYMYLCKGNVRTAFWASIPCSHWPYSQEKSYADIYYTSLLHGLSHLFWILMEFLPKIRSFHKFVSCCTPFKGTKSFVYKITIYILTIEYRQSVAIVGNTYFYIFCLGKMTECTVWNIWVNYLPSSKKYDRNFRVKAG